MKTMNLYAIASLLLGVFVLPLEGATESSSHSQSANSSKTHASHAEVDEEEDEYDILDRDQVDDTDAYEIPYGDSEVEDEEEVNRIEGKDLFHLPKPHTTK